MTQFHVGRPNIGDHELFLRYAREILESRWLTNDGQYVKAFESAVAERLNVKHVVAVCNATVGLEILLNVGVAGKGKVIVPDYTFIATAHAVLAAGHQVLIADVDPQNHCLCPKSVLNNFDEDVKAILGVHLWGNPCFVDELSEIARDRRVHLFYDAAHSFGSKYCGRSIGCFGDAEVFSFHATKILNTFEGGAITTNDDGLAEKCRRARNFGFVGTDQIASFGINGKMSEVSAAMGLVNLLKLDSFIESNHLNFKEYSDRLARIPGISPLTPTDRTFNNFHYLVAEVDSVAFGRTRDELVSFLWSQGVLARRYFYPGVSRSQPYIGRISADVPNSRDLCDRVVVLPTGPSLTTVEIERIVSLVEASRKQ